MSTDLVDDLHYAEDTIGDLAAVLERVRAFRLSNPWTGLDDGPAELRDAVDAAVATAATYCRPTCGANGPRERCEDEDPALCGCPCHEREAP
jgi:hypothetical protein